MSRGNISKKKPSFRGGKNKKKSWKKCDITEVEEYLEDKRLEERIGDVSKKTDEELFCLERTGGKSSDVKNKIKTLKCHSSIGAFTKVPPPIIINKEPFSKKIQNAQFRADQRRRKSARLRASEVKKEKENTISNDLYTADLKDLWCEEEKIDPEIKDFVVYHKEITCEKTPKVPLHRYQKPSLLPAVEVPHAGASYNPTYEDHQKLLSEALEIEEAKNQEELHLKRVLTDMFPTKENAPTADSILKEMSQGLFDEEGMEEQDETEQPTSRYRNPPVTTENRIPKSRKRRKKEQKEQERLKKLEQLRKMQLNQVYRLRSIKGEIKQEEEISQKRQEKKLQRKIGKMYKPLTLSKHKYEAPDIEIQLPDELCDSLRTLKAEGNLLEDRYKSLQRRNLIEPRVAVKRKRKYKLKVQVKRSHRNFQ